MDLNEFDESDRVTLWVTGAMSQMREYGLVTTNFELTPGTGVQAWDQLDAAWKPNDDQLSSFVQYFSDVRADAGMPMDGEEQEGMFILLQQFRDRRDAVEQYVREVLHYGKDEEQPDDAGDLC